jgi:hypothetical protein
MLQCMNNLLHSNGRLYITSMTRKFRLSCVITYCSLLKAASYNKPREYKNRVCSIVFFKFITNTY